MSGDNAVSAAARLSTSCSVRLAPMIGAVIAGLANTQATESWAIDRPASLATSAIALTVSNSRSCQ